MDLNPCAWFSGLPACVAHSRIQVAEFLGVDAASMALIPNASAGVADDVAGEYIGNHIAGEVLPMP